MGVVEETSDTELIRVAFCRNLQISGTILDSLAIIANLFALLVLASVKHKKSQIIFLFSLAMSNLIYPVADMAFMFTLEFECKGEYRNGSFNHHPEWNTTTNIIGYMSLKSIHDTAVSATLYISFAMTMDRLVAILKPLRYGQIVTKRKIYLTTAICWCLALLGFLSMIQTITTGPLPTWEDRYIPFIKAYSIFTYTFTFFLLLILIITYSYLFRQIRKAHSFAKATNQNIHDKYKGTVTVFIIVCSFAVCWIPANVFDIYHYSMSQEEIRKNYQTIATIYLVLRSIFRLNAILDPITYVSLNKHIRQSTLFKLFWKELGKDTTQLSYEYKYVRGDTSQHEVVKGSFKEKTCRRDYV